MTSVIVGDASVVPSVSQAEALHSHAPISCAPSCDPFSPARKSKISGAIANTQSHSMSHRIDAIVPRSCTFALCLAVKVEAGPASEADGNDWHTLIVRVMVTFAVKHTYPSPREYEKNVK